MTKILFTCFALFISCSLHASEDALAYLSYTGEYWQAFVLKSDDKTAKRVTDTDFDISTISWLANGEQLFLNGLQGELGIVDISSGEYKEISTLHKSSNDAVITRDGKRIAYSAILEHGRDNKLFYFDMDSKKLFPLFHDLAGRQYDPKWSKDGNFLYFISGKSNDHYDVVRGDIATGRINVLVNNALYNLDVDVSDSGHIAYSSNVHGNYDVWIQTERAAINITKDASVSSHPAWNKEGTRLYFEKVQDGIPNIWAAGISSLVNELEIKQVTFTSRGSRYPVVYKSWD